LKFQLEIINKEKNTLSGFISSIILTVQKLIGQSFLKFILTESIELDINSSKRTFASSVQSFDLDGKAYFIKIFKHFVLFYFKIT
jgi:hypothetical protein